MSSLSDGEMFNTEKRINIELIKENNKNSINNLVSNLTTEEITKTVNNPKFTIFKHYRRHQLMTLRLA